MTLYNILCFPNLSIRLDKPEIAGNQLRSQRHIPIVAIVDAVRTYATLPRPRSGI